MKQYHGEVCTPEKKQDHHQQRVAGYNARNP